MLKTNTYRVHFVGRDYEDAHDEEGVLIRNKTWQELLDEKLDAGGQFIAYRYFNGATELTVREPIQAAD